MAYPAIDVLARVEGIAHAERGGRARHELHQPLGALVRDGPRIEGGLHTDDRLHEVGGHAVARGDFANLLAEARADGFRQPQPALCRA